jgi:hypothetical protein
MVNPTPKMRKGRDFTLIFGLNASVIAASSSGQGGQSSRTAKPRLLHAYVDSYALLT